MAYGDPPPPLAAVPTLAANCCGPLLLHEVDARRASKVGHSGGHERLVGSGELRPLAMEDATLDDEASSSDPKGALEEARIIVRDA